MKNLSESILSSTNTGGKFPAYEKIYRNFSTKYKKKTGYDILGNRLCVGDYVMWFEVFRGNIVESVGKIYNIDNNMLSLYAIDERGTELKYSCSSKSSIKITDPILLSNLC